VNDRGQLGYSTASVSRKEDIMSMPHLIGHRFMTYDSAGVELIDI
jgi:hypothetical protein